MDTAPLLGAMSILSTALGAPTIIAQSRRAETLATARTCVAYCSQGNTKQSPLAKHTRRRYTLSSQMRGYHHYTFIFSILCYTILLYILLYYILPYYTILYHTIPYYTILYYTILYSILYTIYYILYTIYYILYTIYYILYTIYYILYTIYYTIRYDTIRYDTIQYTIL